MQRIIFMVFLIHMIGFVLSSTTQSVTSVLDIWQQKRAKHNPNRTHHKENIKLKTSATTAPSPASSTETPHVRTPDPPFDVTPFPISTWPSLESLAPRCNSEDAQTASRSSSKIPELLSEVITGVRQSDANRYDITIPLSVSYGSLSYGVVFVRATEDVHCRDIVKRNDGTLLLRFGMEARGFEGIPLEMNLTAMTGLPKRTCYTCVLNEHSYTLSLFQAALKQGRRHFYLDDYLTAFVSHRRKYQGFLRCVKDIFLVLYFKEDSMMSFK